MKKQLAIAMLICIFFVTKNLVAQNPVATLEHNGTTQVFYGSGALVDAYNASVNGDEILLSTGFFVPPSKIEKGIKIIGAGHFPDSVNVARRTTLTGPFYVSGNGADSLYLEGFYINSGIWFEDLSTNYVTISRCGLMGSIEFNSSSDITGKNYCTITECFIGSVNFSNYGENLLIKHCVIQYNISNIPERAIVEGNIFLFSTHFNGEYILNNVSGSLIRNNIFSGYAACNNINNNTFQNNLFLGDTFCYDNNSCLNNHFIELQSDIFANQIEYTINYTNDYHLKNPGLYLGTDGTQVGIYGGTVPFKEKGLPSNPQVITKSVASETDASGNLNINFTIKAQEN